MPFRRIVPAFVLALVTALGACAPSPSPSPSPNPGAGPTPSPTGTPSDPLAVYAAIAEQVAAIRGLEPTAAITPVLIDEATLRENLAREFDASNRPEDVAADERLLRALGLLGPDVGLRDAILDLNGSQVIGYYSNSDDALYVVDRGGALGPTARVTYAHEFVHQLQDQAFDLESLGLDAADGGDRSLAVRAMVEGDASLAQVQWLTSNLTPDEMAELVRDATDPAVTEALAKAPRILVAMSLFPYEDGTRFVAAIGGFKAVDAAYARPPVSTEQILHPEKYLAGEGADPPFDEMPDPWLQALGPGWSVAQVDTLGEFLIRFWLGESGVATAEAVEAAAGWAGDRIVLLDGPDGAVAVVISTAWDSAADAADFADAASLAVTQSDLEARVVTGPGQRVDVTLVSDAAVSIRLGAAVAGR